MKFKLESEETSNPLIKRTIEFEEVYLPNILEQFHYFLLSCGFSPKGELQYIEDQSEISLDDISDEYDLDYEVSKPGV